MIDRSQADWYKDAVIYQLHIKAFFDANNDGIGDFAGLMQKLDYVQELGVNTVWLLPFYPSPLRDDGYDIADYRNVNPSFGTLRDVRTFVKAAHERGLRVITELVINHTSDQHPWFQRARLAKRGSAHRNYYVWSDSDQRYLGTGPRPPQRIATGTSAAALTPPPATAGRIVTSSPSASSVSSPSWKRMSSPET